ncbi:glycosyltransferase family 4 protein [Caballeronia sordidicola]|uniref:Glycosyltransferase n=1 Tax=Caballeronia sordidicola TaxID=196367 RepID=A0A242MWY2_CABSO|nr:glycosyltransferase family 4 protein [Caballeronia sordidicola]OTP75948.1 Glycosyltransferase [Caballeronia sordidicola]
MHESSRQLPPRVARVVAQIGPDLSAQGGIASVLKSYSDYRTGFEEFGYHLIFISSGGSATSGKARKFVAAWCQLFWLALLGRVDLVHLHSSIKGSLLRKSILALTCVVLRKKYVMHIHSGAFAQYYGALPAFIQTLVRFVMTHAACVISLSEHARSTLIAMNLATADKCRLVYNGIKDPLPSGPEARKATPKVSITFLGKLSESKGLVTLFEALAMLSHSAPAYALFVGGSGDASTLADWISKYKLDDVVIYKGWISGDDKIQLLKDTRIFVLPSYSEGFPVAIVEAMAFGATVVSTQIPGVMDAIRPGRDGLLVQPGDVEGLSAALLRLLNDETLCCALSATARQRFLECFTIERSARLLASIYDEAT